MGPTTIPTQDVGSCPEDPQPAGYRPQTGITAYWVQVCVEEKSMESAKAEARNLAAPLGRITTTFGHPEIKPPPGTVVFWVEVPTNLVQDVIGHLKERVHSVRRYHFSRIDDVPGPYVPAEPM